MVPFIGHPWLGQGTAESRTAGWRDLAAYPRKGDARTLNAQVSKSEWKGQYKLKRACSEFHYFPLLCSSASAFLYMYVHYTSRPPPHTIVAVLHNRWPRRASTCVERTDPVPCRGPVSPSFAHATRSIDLLLA